MSISTWQFIAAVAIGPICTLGLAVFVYVINNQKANEVKTDLTSRISEAKADLGSKLDEVKADVGSRLAELRADLNFDLTRSDARLSEVKSDIEKLITAQIAISLSNFEARNFMMLTQVKADLIAALSPKVQRAPSTLPDER